MTIKYSNCINITLLDSVYIMMLHESTKEESSRSHEMSLSAPSCLMKPFDMVFRAYFFCVSGSLREMAGAPTNPAPRNHFRVSNHQAATAQMGTR